MNFKYSGKAAQTDYKRLKIDSFAGVDFSNSKLNVSKNRSTDMTNFIHKDGVNHKRYGWSEIAKFTDSNGDPLKINGFWHFIDTELPYSISHKAVSNGSGMLDSNTFIVTNAVGALFYTNQKVSIGTTLGGDEIASERTISAKSVGASNTVLTVSGASFDSVIGNIIYTSKQQREINVVHAGTKIYRVTEFEDNPIDTLKTDISGSNTGILDERSYGVTKGNRLYLFVGENYLVYRKTSTHYTWELVPVAEDSQTYVPVTTIGISANGSTVNVKESHDEINLLTKKRRNKLIGESLTSTLYRLPLESFIDTTYFEGKTKYASTYNKGYAIPQTTYANVDYLRVEVSAPGRAAHWDIPVTITETAVVYDETTYPLALPEDLVPLFDVSVLYETGGVLTAHAYFGSATASVTVNLFLYRKQEFQLDTTNLDANSDVKIWVDNTYVGVVGTAPLANDTINRTTGVLVMTTRYVPPTAGISNIIVEFEKTVAGSADKINKCKFGMFFGYDNVENLFVSGNPDYPNYDYHSSYPDSSETTSGIPVEEDLTYFGDLGYSVCGTRQSAIIGYTVLGDETLAIHKEDNYIDPALYLRTAVLTDVTDTTGAIVYDALGNPYQEISYPLYAGSMGEGMLTRFASASLVNEKLFLSRNGVFALNLNSNIKSAERYAFERSRLINTALIKEANLEEASAIAFDNRYYLSVNGNCYIADARFKNQLNAEMDDSFSYEWWFWDNVDARIWFIFDHQLHFGTPDGQICKFSSTVFEDTSYEQIGTGGITFSDATNTFTLSNTYDEVLADLDEGSPIVLEGLDLVEELPNVSVTAGVATTDFTGMFDTFRYLEDKKVRAYIPDTTFANQEIDTDVTGWIGTNYFVTGGYLRHPAPITPTTAFERLSPNFEVATGTWHFRARVRVTNAVCTKIELAIFNSTTDSQEALLDTVLTPTENEWYELSGSFKALTTPNGGWHRYVGVYQHYATVEATASKQVQVDYLRIYNTTTPSTEYTLKNFDNEALTFELWGDSDGDGVLALETGVTATNTLLLRELDGEEVHIINLDADAGTFQLSWDFDEQPTIEAGAIASDYIPIDVTVVSPADIGDIWGYFRIAEPVESYWETPIFDLGTAEYNKNLYSITLTPEAMVGGEIEFGFKTREMLDVVNESNLFEVQGVNLFDFNNIDFTRFTFETSTFAKSYTKKLKIKRFNFILFYFRSTNNQDSVVNNLSITYSINRLNKGVK